MLLGAATLPACTVAVPSPSAAPTPSATSSPSPKPTEPAEPPGAAPVTVTVSPVPGAVTVTVSEEPDGPRIDYLRIARQPKCAEGTAVFRADPVPLLLEWRISGASGGSLSVDDPTNTPGTYGPVELEGSLEFPFSCAGEVGTTETHTYALYATGGGAVRSRVVTASATVLDNGLGTT